MEREFLNFTRPSNLEFKQFHAGQEKSRDQPHLRRIDRRSTLNLIPSFTMIILTANYLHLE